MKKLYIILLLVSICGMSSAQGRLKGKITDGKEPIPYACIVVFQGDKRINSCFSDLDGNYMINPIPAGKYDVKALLVDYKPRIIKNVIIKNNEVTYLDFKLTSEKMIPENVIIEYEKTSNSQDTTSSNKKER